MKCNVIDCILANSGVLPRIDVYWLVSYDRAVCQRTIDRPARMETHKARGDDKN